LTSERIVTLPAAQQAVWKKYLRRSEQQWQADQNFLRTEMRSHGIKTPLVPLSSSSARSIPLNRPLPWYGSNEAVRIAGIIISFQTPAGGWSKNLNLAEQARVPGESFAPDNNSRLLGKGDFDSPPAGHWDYVGTFDNNATVSELYFLAKVIAAGGTNQVATWRASFLCGLDYIFAAQYPNGGWPQVWPRQGGYHDAITYNDGAMINILNLLRDVSTGTNEFAFVPEKTRRLAAASLQRGLACVLATQIVVGGRRTVWCQQHDPLTLQPVSARNYEMPSEVSSESAQIMMFLMEQLHPGPEIIESVNAAAVWFEKTQIPDMAFKFVPGEGRRLASTPGNGPIWARNPVASMAPEEIAREQIDAQLLASGWIIRDYKALNLSAGRGIPLREVPLKSGTCDYLLLVDRKPVGVVEAKKQGTLLSGVAEQSGHYAENLPDFLAAMVAGSMPFVYESTGVETFFRDERDPDPRSRPVFSFHRPETLAGWLTEPAQEKPWTQKLWIYDLRTNLHFTLKKNTLKRTDLDDFVKCYNPKNRQERKETKRFKSFAYDNLLKRGKVNLDIFWLKDDALEESANLPAPEIIAQEITDDLEAALEQFSTITEDLKK
jgi:PelA/Pel-15E family pectate lyase